MSGVLKYLIDAAVAAFSTWLVMQYFSMFFPAGRWERRTGMALLLFFLSQAAVIHENALPDILNLAFASFAVYMVGYCCFEGREEKKIWISISYMAFWILVEILAWGAFRSFELKKEVALPAGSVCSKLGMFAMVLVFKNFSFKQKAREYPSDYAWHIVLIPLGSLFVSGTLFFASNMYEPLRFGVAVSVLVLLGLNVIVFQSYGKLARDRESKRQSTAYNRQIGLYSGYLRDKEEEIREFHRCRHDLKQNLLCLQEMLLRQETAPALSLLEQLLAEQKKIVKGYSNTGNIAVDAVVNSKAVEAAKKGIRVECSLCIPAQLPFGDSDLCILLGNSLDNALEAVTRMPDSDRLIHLTLRCEKGCLVFTLTNPFDGRLRRGLDGRFLSMKEQAENHGIGLESMRRVTEKYNGRLVTEADIKRIPAEFTVKAVLFPPKE